VPWRARATHVPIPFAHILRSWDAFGVVSSIFISGQTGAERRLDMSAVRLVQPISRLVALACYSLLPTFPTLHASI